MSNPLARILGRGSLFTLATAAPILSALVITPALTRILALAEYGHVSAALSLLNLIVSVLALGLPLIIVRQTYVDATGSAGARGLVLQGAAVALLTALLAAGVAMCWPGGRTPTTWLAILAGGAGAGVAMTQSVFVAGKSPGRYVLLAFGTSVLAPASGLGAVLLTRPTASAYVIAHAAAVGFTLLLGLALVLRTGRPVLSWRGFRAALRLSLPLVPHQLAITGALALSVLIARARLGAGAAGQAQPSLLLASAPLIVISAMCYAWLPEVLEASPEQQPELMRETATTITWLAALAAGAVALAAPLLLRYLAPRYGVATMVPVVGVAALAGVVGTVFQAHIQVVFVTGRTAPLLWASPLSLVLGGAVGALLAPRLGLLAVAVGYVVGYLCLALVARRLAAGLRWDERGLLAPLLLALALCGAGAAVPAAGAFLLARVVSCCGVAVGAVWLYVKALRGGA